MRKSTVVVLAILLVGMVVLTLIYNYYVSQLIEEARNAKTVTTELAADLEPGTKIQLSRVAAGPRYVVKEGSVHGLVAIATPSVAAWKADPSGDAFGRRLTVRLFELYGDERPVQFVELRLTRPDKVALDPFAYTRGPGKTILAVPR